MDKDAGWRVVDEAASWSPTSWTASEPAVASLCDAGPSATWAHT